MNDKTVQMQQIAKEIIEQGQAEVVIGWEKGTFWYLSPPAFIDKAEEIENLVWDDYCHNNLSKYLLDYKHHEGKVAVFLKGCDSRALIRLIQDKQIDREKVYIVGVPCHGLKDQEAAKGLKPGSEAPIAGKCQGCKYPTPVLYDVMLKDEKILDEVAATVESRDFSEIKELENMTADEKYDFWTKEYDKCLRCYACRNICPACSCRECVFDQTRVGWIGKANNSSENQFFALTRAMHVAGRCVECGECERACPVNIPIMLLNKKLTKDINELFGEYDAATEVDQETLLGNFKVDDPEEFL